MLLKWPFSHENLWGLTFQASLKWPINTAYIFLTQPQPWEAVPWDDHITNKCTRADLDGPPGMCFFFNPNYFVLVKRNKHNS